MKKNLFLISLMALLLAACSMNTPRGFERVVKDVERNGAEYTQKDWDKADARFEKFCKKYDRYELRKMSREEQRQVGRLMARYTKARAKYALGGLGDLFRAGSSLVAGIADELKSVDKDVSGYQEDIDGDDFDLDDDDFGDLDLLEALEGLVE